MAGSGETGHLGRMFLDCLRSREPNDILQIDGASGEEETFGSVLSRSIRLARALRNCGFRPGDVLALAGRNHLDLHIPHYAGLFNGLPVLGLDPSFKYNDIKCAFERCKPKIVFCEQHTAADFEQASIELGLNSKIVTFKSGNFTMSHFIDTFDNNTSEADYKCVDFDPDKTVAWIVCTSGTTSMPKFAAFLHHPLSKRLMSFENRNSDKTKMTLLVSPIQWISHLSISLLPLYHNTIKLQTPRVDDIAHLVDVINKYKPCSVMMSPSMIVSIMKHENKCDLTCFDIMLITGAKIHKQHLIELKARLRENAILIEAHGMTETLGPILKFNPFGPLNSCGVFDPTTPTKACQSKPVKPYQSVNQICTRLMSESSFKMPPQKLKNLEERFSHIPEKKLVDPDTGKDITEPLVTGEIWSKGPCFDGYYNDPETTRNAFSEDGWFKTGDLMYRDDQNNFFFVERLKTLIKYRNYHIYPSELEDIIQTLEGVEEVAVTGLPQELDSEHPVAFVVKKPGALITADDVKKVVAENLTDSKNLRGGVVFVDEIPKTSTGKIWRAKLKELVRDYQPTLTNDSDTLCQQSMF